VPWPGLADDHDTWPANKPFPSGLEAQVHTHGNNSRGPSYPGNSVIPGSRGDYGAAEQIHAITGRNLPVFVINRNGIWRITSDPLSSTNPTKIAEAEWWKSLGKINFSLQRGNPVDEIKIALSSRFTPVKKRKRASR
jgi:hypothetical protein